MCVLRGADQAGHCHKGSVMETGGATAPLPLWDTDAPANAPAGVRHPDPLLFPFSPKKRLQTVGCVPTPEGMERADDPLRADGSEQAAVLLHGWTSLWEHQPT